MRSSQFRFVLAGTCVAIGAIGIGCTEPNYRTEVTSRGQGEVEVHHVPKDAPPSSLAEASPTDPTRQQRIERLEARKRQIDAELQTLKQEPATQKAP